MATSNPRRAGVDGRTVAQRLNDLRTARGLTPADLADRAGLKEWQVTDIELGVAVRQEQPRLVALADALDCPQAFMMYGFDDDTITALHADMQAAMDARVQHANVRACRLYAGVINHGAMRYLPELYHDAGEEFRQALISLGDRRHDRAVAVLSMLAADQEPGSPAWAMIQAQRAATYRRAGHLDRAFTAGTHALDQISGQAVWAAEVGAIGVELAPEMTRAGRYPDTDTLLDRIATRLDPDGSPEWQYRFHCAAVEAAAIAKDSQRVTYHAKTAWTCATDWPRTSDVPPDLLATMVNGLARHMLAWEHRRLARIAHRYLSRPDIPWDACQSVTQAHRSVHAARADRILGNPQAAVERLGTILDPRDDPQHGVQDWPAELTGRAKAEMGRALGDLGHRLDGASYLRSAARDLAEAGQHHASKAAHAQAVLLTVPPAGTTRPATPSTATADTSRRQRPAPNRSLPPDRTPPPGNRTGPASGSARS